MFLWYLLRYRLHHRQPTVFAIGGSPHLFNKNGAYIKSRAAREGQLTEDAASASPSELVWALIDRLNEKTEPPTWLVTTELFPVQSTSPDTSRYKGWMKV